MLQSYKTILRLPWLVTGSRALFFVVCCWLLLARSAAGQVAPAKPPKPAKPDHRRAAIFPHYEYRFTVPNDRASAVWRYLLDKYNAPESQETNARQTIEEEQLTDVYFDTPAKSLLHQNLVLRQRLFISAEGRKQHLQLLLPPLPDSALGRNVRFRYNKNPDKGKAFTSHPVLKLLRKKDRPTLDSLLKPYRINVQQLNVALEINQDRKRFPAVKPGSEWLLLTLTELQVQAPEHWRYEVQLEADPQTLKQASPARKKQMVQQIQDIARQLQQKFPDIKPARQPEYVVMENLRKKPAVQKINTKVVFGLSFLALFLGVWLVRKFRKKPKQAFDQ